MTRSDRVILVVGELCTADNMAPLYTDLVTSLDIYDLAARRRPRVTRDVSVVHVHDWVVGRCYADTVALAIVLTVDSDTLSDSMRRCKSGKKSEGGGEELHLEDWNRMVIEQDDGV